METNRLILFISLFFVTFLLWDAWQRDYVPQPVAQNTTIENKTEIKNTDIPEAPQDKIATSQSDDSPFKEKEVFKKGKQLHIITDVFDIEIDTRGGDIRKTRLIKYPVSSKTPDDPFPLMNDTLPNIFIAQTGIISSEDAPDHHALFSAKQAEYKMRDNSDELKVQLFWQGKGGVNITKTYTFLRGSYLIKIDYEVQSTTEWQGRLYSQFQRAVGEDNSSRFIYTYTGGVISSKEKPYKKISFDDMADADLKQTIEGG